MSIGMCTVRSKKYEICTPWIAECAQSAQKNMKFVLRESLRELLLDLLPAADDLVDRDGGQGRLHLHR